MFWIFKRVTCLERQVAELKEQLDAIDFNNGFLAMADRIADEARQEIAKAAPKEKLKVTTYKKSDPIPFQPKWMENTVSYDKEGRIVYAPKKKAHLNEDKTFMVSYGEPVKKKRGRPRKIK